MFYIDPHSSQKDLRKLTQRALRRGVLKELGSFILQVLASPLLLLLPAYFFVEKYGLRKGLSCFFLLALAVATAYYGFFPRAMGTVLNVYLILIAGLAGGMLLVRLIMIPVDYRIASSYQEGEPQGQSLIGQQGLDWQSLPGGILSCEYHYYIPVRGVYPFLMEGENAELYHGCRNWVPKAGAETMEQGEENDYLRAACFSQAHRGARDGKIYFFRLEAGHHILTLDYAGEPEGALPSLRLLQA